MIKLNDQLVEDMNEFSVLVPSCARMEAYEKQGKELCREGK